MATESGEQVRGVYVDHLERILDILSHRVLTVMEAHRYAEEHAHIRNRIGRNNLTEALSHLARIAESANEMSYGEQRDQIAHFEDHLRRTMMESFEVVAKARLGKIKEEGLWDEYRACSHRLSRLPGTPREEEITELGRQVRFYMEEGRKRKTAYEWEEWTRGAEYFARACEKADDLKTKLTQAIGAAREARRFHISVAFGIVGTVIGIVGLVIAIASVA